MLTDDLCTCRLTKRIRWTPSGPMRTSGCWSKSPRPKCCASRSLTVTTSTSRYGLGRRSVAQVHFEAIAALPSHWPWSSFTWSLQCHESTDEGRSRIQCSICRVTHSYTHPHKDLLCSSRNPLPAACLPCYSILVSCCASQAQPNKMQRHFLLERNVS